MLLMKMKNLNYLAKMLDLEIPLLGSLLSSNNIQVMFAIKKIISYGKKKIGVAGFSFKAGTDDIRGSPIIEVVETLIGKGYDIKLYDKDVSIAKLMGTNKEYIDYKIPHISTLMVDSLDELLKDSEIIVIGNNSQEFRRLINESRDDQLILDLVRITDMGNTRENYEGICW